jgi:hypothetical protein
VSIRLRHVAAVNPPTHEFDVLPDTAELPFLPLEAVWPGDRLDTTRRQPKSAVSSGYTRFREGDILLPKITPTFQADRTVIVKGLEGGVGAGTTELHVVRAGPDADVRYLRYLLSSKKFLDEGEASMLGVAGQKRVPDDCLRDLRVPVVDLRHQRAIADYLDRETARIDALIEKKQTLTQRLSERRQALITAAVQGDIGPGAASRGDGVRWVSTRLKFLAAIPIRNGLGESGRQDDPAWPRYIRTTDIAGPRSLRDDVFSSLPPDTAREAMLQQGDIVMTAAGATIGKSLLYNSTELACYAGYLVRFRARSDVDPRFVSYWMESLPYWDQIETGKVVSTIENFSASKYQNLFISIPDLPVQHAIADYLDQETACIDALIDKINRQIDLLQEHRQALITAAVTGELDIPGVAA